MGHSSDVCYANGKGEKPVKRNYKLSAGEGLRQEKLGADGLGVGGVESALGSDSFVNSQPGVEGMSMDDGKGDGLVQDGLQVSDDGGFQHQERKRGKQGKGAWDVSGLKEGSPGARVLGGSGSDGELAPLLKASENRFSILSSVPLDSPVFSLGSMAKEHHSQPRYLKMLPNGDFDSEVYEDEKEWEDDGEMGCEAGLYLDRLVDKRGVVSVVEKTMEENVTKKGRLLEGTSSEVV